MELAIATAADVPLIGQIYEEARQALANLGIGQWQTGYPTKETIARDVEGGALRIVVADDGEIAGCVQYSAAGERDYDRIDGAWVTDSTSADPDYVVVHRVAVGKNHARQGIGSFAIAGAFLFAEELGRKSVRIDTHAGNIRMRSMLEKLGFTECGIITLSELDEATRERIAYEKLLG